MVDLLSKHSAVSQTREWYKNYYSDKGSHRNDLLRNSEVLFQTIAYDASLVSALRSIKLDSTSALILDVGCGGGGSLLNFLRFGFIPSQLYGIDILEERILEARYKYPNINWISGDAINMRFADNTFDLVFESTMFVQITDDDLAKRIASEMLRVTKCGGYILLIDWRYSKPWEAAYRGLSIRRIKELFTTGSKCQIEGVFRGALVPPLGRFVSKRFPSGYFLLQRLFPFLVGQIAVTLKKINDEVEYTKTSI
jgi:ubiquinone/menaquinone biosynthesis C-methylase UbiE